MKIFDGQPCHGESFAGPVGGDTNPNEPHPTWGDDLSANHRGPAEMSNI